MKRVLAALGLCLALAIVAYATPLLAPGRQGPEPAPSPHATSGARADDSPPVRRRIDIAWLPPTIRQHEAPLVAAGVRHRIDPELLAIVTLVESGGYAAARSPSGARGLMQIMPSTGRVIAAERNIGGYRHSQLEQPAFNIDFGAWYFAKQLNDFRIEDPADSIERAAAAYNGGPGWLRRHLQGDEGLPEQTRRYRGWVRGMWEQRRARRSEVYQRWYDAGGERLVARAMDAMQAAKPALSR